MNFNQSDIFEENTLYLVGGVLQESIAQTMLDFENLSTVHLGENEITEEMLEDLK